MAVIGIYDSGIGGLTTAEIILDRFPGNDIYYLADNLHHPFGNADEDALKEIVCDGIKRVRAHSDIVVLACNTASSVTDDENVIKLLPPTEEFLNEAQNVLVMATARTLSKLKDADKFKIADTRELATLVEIQASLQSAKGNLDMRELLPYIATRVHKFKGVSGVILGCSHYLYCKEQITKVLGDVKFFDGNEILCNNLAKSVSTRPEYPAKITFEFTSQNDRKKYETILKILKN